MASILFVHGINTRGEGWFRTLDLVSRKAEQFLPGIRVSGCQWGETLGAYLHKDGASIPNYSKTGNAAEALEDASRARWFLLAENPLLETRILPEQRFIGEKPGIGIFTLIPPLAANADILALLASWEVARPWPDFINSISSLVPAEPRYPRLKMATRFPSASNLSASQITIGVFPVPPTVMLPTLITGRFRRFCLSRPRWYSQARSIAAEPYSSENGQTRAASGRGMFIAARRPEALRFRRGRGRWLRDCRPPGASRFRPSGACVPGRAAARSTPRRRPRGFRPARRL